MYSLENRTNPLLPSKNVLDLIIRKHDSQPYWNVKTDRWETEGGSYQLLVGASVQDIRLRAEVSVRWPR